MWFVVEEYRRTGEANLSLRRHNNNWFTNATFLYYFLSQLVYFKNEMQEIPITDFNFFIYSIRYASSVYYFWQKYQQCIFSEIPIFIASNTSRHFYNISHHQSHVAGHSSFLATRKVFLVPYSGLYLLSNNKKYLSENSSIVMNGGKMIKPFRPFTTHWSNLSLSFHSTKSFSRIPLTSSCLRSQSWHALHHPIL